METKKTINGMEVIKTGWGAVIPAPMWRYLKQYIPLKFIISIADKARNYKWITPRGRLHVDSNPYYYVDDIIMLKSNKYNIHITHSEMFVKDAYGRLLFYKQYPRRVFYYFKALVLLNRLLNERELKTA